jgi:DNA-binding NarL/FixJ family response regulator
MPVMAEYRYRDVMETRSIVRVLLAVNHPSIRRSLRTILEDDDRCRVVAELGDSVEGVRQSEQLKPDVSIIDISTSAHALDAVRQTVCQSFETRILALGSHAGPAYASHVRQAGAAGYVVTDCAEARLGDAVAALAAGRLFFDGCDAAAIDDESGPDHGSSLLRVAWPLRAAGSSMR